MVTSDTTSKTGSPVSRWISAVYGAEITMLGDEPPGHRDVLGARPIHVEHQLVVEEDPRELLLRLHPGHRDGNVARDAGAREVLRGEAGRADGHDAHAAAGAQHPMDERHEQQAGREHGDGHRRAQLMLELGEEAAVGGDGPHALALQRSRPLDKGRQQRRSAPPDHQVGLGSRHAVVANGERKRRRVAHVARDTREPSVEHEDTHGEPVLVEPAPHAPGDHVRLLYLSSRDA